MTVDSPTWDGTATELAAEYHIRYENSRSHAGRSITLILEPPRRDDRDGFFESGGGV